MKCPHCGEEIDNKHIAHELGEAGGKSTSPAKQKAARKNGKAGGRKLTTGCCETRKELEGLIWHLYRNTDARQTDIAKIVKVSETTVAHILSKPEGI